MAASNNYEEFSMHKAIWVVAALASAPAAMAASSGPGCGWGTQTFKGQAGLSAHTLAGTTNGTTINQILGLASGTNGCNQDAVVSVEARRNEFVASNFDNVARDAALGEGVHIDVLATLTGVEATDRAAFAELLQAKHTSLFSGDAESMLTALTAAMAENSQLAKYAA